MTRHLLKIWPEPFEALANGSKRYEVRENDRGFAVGDQVRFLEWIPETKDYSGREVEGEITHLTPAGEWGLPPNLCVFGIRVNV